MTDEVRTTSSTGGQKGVKGARYGLLPVRPLREVAELYGAGAEKYEDRNWERGYEWSKSFDSLMRHAQQFWGGEDVDPEFPNKHHLAAVVFHALALIEWGETHPEFDNRPTTVARREAIGLAGTEDDGKGHPEDCKACDDYSVWEAMGAARRAVGFWENIGYTTDLPAGSIFTAPLTPKVDVDAFLGRHTLTFESSGLDDDRIVRFYAPNAKVEDQGDGKMKVTPLPAPERPLAVGTEVIVMIRSGDDPIEGRIEAIERHGDVSIGDGIVWYTYGVRFTYYQKQLLTDVTRSQLYVSA